MNQLGPLDLQRMIVAEMCSSAKCVTDGGQDFWCSMTQQQGTVSQEKVDILISIDVPLSTSFTVLYVQWHGNEVPQIMPDTTGDHLLSSFVPGYRDGTSGGVF